MANIPFLKPAPARLSRLVRELEELEASGTFSNFGPVNRRFEHTIVDRLFGGIGAVATVNNATMGLVLAIRDAIGETGGRGRYALMPSFTFAALAQAALWNGLTPLFCDIDPEDWAVSPEAEEELLNRYKDEVAVVTPYATFGNAIDLSRYRKLTERFGVPVVIDAAASLGSLDARGRGFGTGSQQPVVFSMHATKPMATSEGGLVYCSDPAVVQRIRVMSNYGFAEPRISSLPGLNAKLPEIGAVLALAKLDELEPIVLKREAVDARYRANLPGWTFQRQLGQRTAHTFTSVLLPEGLAHRRSEILKNLADQGIGAATYFSPHLAEHPYFKTNSVAADLTVTEKIAARILALPLFDDITMEQVDQVSDALKRVTQ
jgi:dTDP-4-amino-4,6-dideoxygalactose transaminase